MKQSVRVFSIFLMAVLAACAPSTVMPTETVVNAPIDDVFATVSSTINTQPYPEDTSGWIVRQSDQEGGFITAELMGEECVLLIDCKPYTARVSVSLNNHADDRTAVNINKTQHDLAKQLAQRIELRLLSR